MLFAILFCILICLHIKQSAAQQLRGAQLMIEKLQTVSKSGISSVAVATASIVSGCSNPSKQQASLTAADTHLAVCEGSVSLSGAACAAGWHVCTGGEVSSMGVTAQFARSFPGCFRYDAAQDCGGCSDTCTSRTNIYPGASSFCPDSGAGIDTAGMGSQCVHYEPSSKSCLIGGRIDYAKNNGGCNDDDGNGYATRGVVCCASTKDVTEPLSPSPTLMPTPPPSIAPSAVVTQEATGCGENAWCSLGKIEVPGPLPRSVNLH